MFLKSPETGQLRNNKMASFNNSNPDSLEVTKNLSKN